MIAIVVNLLFLIGFVALAPAQTNIYSLTLAWEPPTNSVISGYKVYVGPSSRYYTNIIPAISTSAVISNLVSNRVYYFTVTDSDMFGRESDFDGELAYARSHYLINLDFVVPQVGKYVIESSSNFQGGRWVVLMDGVYTTSTPDGKLHVEAPVPAIDPPVFFRARFLHK